MLTLLSTCCNMLFVSLVSYIDGRCCWWWCVWKWCVWKWCVSKHVCQNVCFIFLTIFFFGKKLTNKFCFFSISNVNHHFNHKGNTHKWFAKHGLRLFINLAVANSRRHCLDWHPIRKCFRPIYMFVKGGDSSVKVRFPYKTSESPLALPSPKRCAFGPVNY